MAEASELIKQPAATADQWYVLACFYSVASSKVADKKQEYADQAMTLLHKAVQAGFNNAAHMERDPDLDPLRDRKDFQLLVAGLAKKE